MFCSLEEISEKKGKNQYSDPIDKGKHKASDEENPSGGETLVFIKCFKCGESGHRENECNNKVPRCFKYGMKGHTVENCKSDGPTCYNCGEQGSH